MPRRAVARQHERGGWPWFPHANHGASGAVGMDFDEMDMNEMDGSGNVGLKEETRDEDVGFMRAGGAADVARHSALKSQISAPTRAASCLSHDEKTEGAAYSPLLQNEARPNPFGSVPRHTGLSCYLPLPYDECRVGFYFSPKRAIKTLLCDNKVSLKIDG